LAAASSAAASFFSTLSASFKLLAICSTVQSGAGLKGKKTKTKNEKRNQNTKTLS
jgi:hypothetical protein